MRERRPLAPGDPAPDFVLSAVTRDAPVSLGDYRDRSGVLITLFRGLHCPFCRRHLVQLGAAQAKLRAAGVETLAIVTTPVERARLYFGHRPTPLALASDPEARTHEAFGVPVIELVREGSARTTWPRTTMEDLAALRVTDPAADGGAPRPVFELVASLNAQDGYEMTPADERTRNDHNMRLTGQFIVDRGGIVRWSHVEARDRMTDLSRLPGEETLLAAARALPA